MKHEKYWFCFYQDEYIAQVAFPPAMPKVDVFFSDGICDMSRARVRFRNHI